MKRVGKERDNLLEAVCVADGGRQCLVLAVPGVTGAEEAAPE